MSGSCFGSSPRAACAVSTPTPGSTAAGRATELAAGTAGRRAMAQEPVAATRDGSGARGGAANMYCVPGSRTTFTAGAGVEKSCRSFYLPWSRGV